LHGRPLLDGLPLSGAFLRASAFWTARIKGERHGRPRWNLKRPTVLNRDPNVHKRSRPDQ
jgi:hypothetical protein